MLIVKRDAQAPKLEQKKVELASLQQIIILRNSVLSSLSQLQTSLKGITHSELQRYSVAIEKKQAELAPVLENLRTYLSLPPDATLTKIEIGKKRAELQQLQEQIEAGMITLREQFIS